MNYKIILKRNNKEILNEVVDKEQLNSSIVAFYKTINTGWDDGDILLHIESTKEKAPSREEFAKKQLDRMFKILCDIINKD